MYVSTMNTFTETNEWAVIEPPEQAKTAQDLFKKIIISFYWPHN